MLILFLDMSTRTTATKKDIIARTTVMDSEYPSSTSFNVNTENKIKIIEALIKLRFLDEYFFW